ncbi:hypothetical protein AQJ64_37240 [Streptomyces griseoruber]|uniref:Transposase IS701-like DDE domain-containing protein n=1 Tax=Streptomyces griseoruber TaxID=1943 RepID=A0A101SMN8_9ACTN|nr:hypothetical protein AQJ64_37240 [Streptomyces griseoruber]
MKSPAAEQSADAALGVLSHFRVQFHDCLYTRADALFELTDAVLCSDGPVTSLIDLTLTAEHRREHGAMYDAVNHGWLEPRRLRRLLVRQALGTEQKMKGLYPDNQLVRINGRKVLYHLSGLRLRVSSATDPPTISTQSRPWTVWGSSSSSTQLVSAAA